MGKSNREELIEIAKRMGLGKPLSKEEHKKLVEGKAIVFPTDDNPDMLNFRFCKDCKWEHAPSFCPNDYKEDMPLHKDGTFQCGYCAWKV